MKPKTYIKTKRDLAEKVGVTRPTLDRYLSKSDAPKFIDGKGFPLDEMLAFIATNADKESTMCAQSSELKGLKAEELALKCRRLRVIVMKEEGTVVLRESVIAAMARILPAANVLIEQKLVNEFPALVANQDAAACRDHGRKLADALREQLRALGGEFEKL